MQTIEQLTAIEEQQLGEVAELREKLSVATANLNATQNERAALCADAAGVHVGDVVEWDEEKWRIGTITRRGRVERIEPYCRAKDFEAYIRLIKKDGALGVRLVRLPYRVFINGMTRVVERMTI